jgi:hypothetical protein
VESQKTAGRSPDGRSLATAGALPGGRSRVTAADSKANCVGADFPDGILRQSIIGREPRSPGNYEPYGRLKRQRR